MRGIRRSVGFLWAVLLLVGAGEGVAAQDDPTDPTIGILVTGRFLDATRGDRPFAHDEETDGDLVQRRRDSDGRSEMSDARLSGDVVLQDNADRWCDGPCGPSTFLGDVLWGTIEITNDGGMWVGTSVGTSDISAGGAGITYYELVGSGGYEGVSAILFETEVWDPETQTSELLWNGVIMPGGLPPERSGSAVPAHDPAAQASAPAQESAAAQASPVADAPGVPAVPSVVDTTWLDDRLVELTIESPSVGEAKVRLLVPASFDEDPKARYPVLYLLHGATQDETQWTELTDVEELTADLDLLVVMPFAGEWGWYSDWWNEGQGGQPAWETFHLEEVRDIIERDWRASEDRVIAGLSMGGYGALHYATAHPEMFKAVASFSGVVDPNGVGRDLFVDLMAWGDPVAQADVWSAHDPVGMAEALRGKPIYLSWGDGQPGPLDPPATYAESLDLEAWVAPQNEALVARLEELGIPVTAESGPGAHEWPYWEQGLHQALPILLASLE